MTTINTNTSATLARQALVRNERAMATAMERLSTGLRINAAKDDAAGFAITQKMAADISGMQMGIRNLNDGISMVQTIEGAYQDAVRMVSRMRELAVQAASGTLTDADRANLDAEYQNIKQGIQDIAKNTQWNGMNLIDGSSTQQTVQLQTGSSIQDISINQLYGEPGTFVFQSNLTATDNFPAFKKYELSGDIQDGDVISMLIDGNYVAITMNNSSNFLKYDNNGTLYDPYASEADKIKNHIYHPNYPPPQSGGEFWEFLGGPSYSYWNQFRDEPVRLEFGKTSNEIANTGEPLWIRTLASNILYVGTGGIWPYPGGHSGYDIDVQEIRISRGDTKYLSGTSISSASHAQTAIVQLDDTISNMTLTMSKFGSSINAIESASSSLMSTVANLQQSQSHIEDADYAVETTNLAKAQIIAQASTAMLAQANQTKQSVLVLLN